MATESFRVSFRNFKPIFQPGLPDAVEAVFDVVEIRTGKRTRYEGRASDLKFQNRVLRMKQAGGSVTVEVPRERIGPDCWWLQCAIDLALEQFDT